MNSMYDYLMHRENGMRKQASYLTRTKLLAYMMDPVKDRQALIDKLQRNLETAKGNKALRESYKKDFLDKTEFGKEQKAKGEAAKERLESTIGKRYDAAVLGNLLGAKVPTWGEYLGRLATENKGALIGAGSSIPAALIAAGVSKENKLRNAALTGLAAGILGTGAGMAYDKFMA